MTKSKKRKRKQINGSADAPLEKIAKTTLQEANLEREMKKKKKTRSRKKKGTAEKNLNVQETATDGECSSQGACSSNSEMMEIENELNAPKLNIDLTQLFSIAGSRPSGKHLHCNDIKNLLLYTVLGNGKWERPTWSNMIHWDKIKHTLFIMVGNVSGEDYIAYKECFKNINKNFIQGYPVKNDGSEGVFFSPLETYLNYRMKKKTAKQKHKNSEGKGTTPDELILSLEQRLVNEYPMADTISENNTNGFVSTKQKRELKDKDLFEEEEKVENDFQMFAIDCEMCETMNGKELTRVSIVNQNHDVVYDSFVKPDAPITNYLTEFSGITALILKDVKTNLGDVQQQILEMITENDIIVGHSLENDLRCLKIFHEKFIDTSIIYGDQRGARFKPSLKRLVKEHLHREIQTNESGHCSIEDAKACMELLQLKLEKGKYYGTLEKPNESIFEAFSRASKTSVVVDTSIIARQHCFLGTHGVLCTSDEEVVRGTKSYANKASFIFSHLKGYEKLLKVCDKNGSKPSIDTVKNTLTKLDSDLGEIIENTEKDSLLVVLFSSGFIPSYIQGLQRDKEMRKTDEVKLAVKKARDCVCFIKVT